METLLYCISSCKIPVYKISNSHPYIEVYRCVNRLGRRELSSNYASEQELECQRDRRILASLKIKGEGDIITDSNSDSKVFF